MSQRFDHSMSADQALELQANWGSARTAGALGTNPYFATNAELVFLRMTAAGGVSRVRPKT